MSFIAKCWPSTVLGLLLAGSPVIADELTARYESAAEKLSSEGERNNVLNNMNAASLSLMRQDYEAAGRHLDDALLRIEAIYSGDAKSAKARSLWYAEGSKDFRGEPYERAMAYFYRGLLDLTKGEYDNARASFKGGLLQDAFADEEQNRADFASLIYLQSWTLHLEGRDQEAAEFSRELGQLRPNLPAPAKNHNLLVIIETGKSPRKVADGVSQNIMVYRKGKRFNDVAASVDNMKLQPMAIEDLYYQASTRGGRQIDKILNGKAQYRSSSERTGDVLGSLSSTAQTVDSVIGNGSAGAAIAGIGVAAGVIQLVGGQVNAVADTRYWPTLPDSIHIATGRLEPGQEPHVNLLDSQGNTLPNQPYVSKLFKDPKDNYVLWVRSLSTIEK